MEYHIGREGQQLGKFQDAQIVEGLKQGNFRPTDLAWTEGMSTWEPLGSLPQFQSIVSAAAPVEPEPPTSVTPAAEPVRIPSQPPAPASTFDTVPVTPVTVLPPVTAAKSPLAVVSLVCGIISIPGVFCCFGYLTAPAAVICGHIALSEINQSTHLESSRGLAKTGLILGYVSLGLAALSILFSLAINMSGLGK